MNMERLTKNSLEAIQNAQNLAQEYGSQEIKQEHLLYSLLTQEESLISELIKKVLSENEGHSYISQGNGVSEFIDELKQKIESMPKIYGAAGESMSQVYVSKDTNDALL